MTSRLIAVRSVQSGAGRTVIASNLAFELAAIGRRVMLIDLDDAWPSLHRYFNLPQEKAAVLAASRLLEQGKLDANALEELAVRLVAKGSSIDFLSGYGLNLNRDALNLATITKVLQHLAAKYDALVIDCAAGISSGMLSAVGVLGPQEIWVSQVDALSLGRFIDCQPQVESAQRVGAEPILALNRMRSSVLGARPEWQVQQVLRERTKFNRATIIPHDDALDSALLRGLPLRQIGGKSKALAAIGELALRLQ
jgi:MinD-like ATPase involved in chromosome partitioning or flagellar assembly